MFGLGLIVVLLLASAGVSYWSTLRVVRSQQWVAHTRHVLAQVQEIRATVMEAEAGQRGFILTGSPAYLEALEHATARIDEEFLHLEDLTADNPVQQARVAELHKLASARLHHLRETASVRQERGLEAARKIVNTDEGQLVTDRIRREVTAMEQAEKALLVDRLARSEYSLRAKNVTTALAALLGLAAVGLAFVVFQRTLEERRQAERRQGAIADLRHHALSDADLDALMDRAVAVVARILDVPLVKVLELLPDRPELLLRAGVGWQDGTVGRATVGAGLDSQAGFTLYASKPVVVGDLTTHQPIVVEDLRTETRFSGPALLSDHGVVSGVSVIIYDRPDRPFGVLGAHTTRPRHFTEQDSRFLQMVANVLATAIQRRRAEDALRESEGRFRALADSIPAIVWTSEPDGRCDYLNRRWTDFSGTTREEAGLEGWMRAVHAEDLAGAREGWMHAVRSGEPFEWECRLRDRDGSYRWCLGRALPLRDAAGHVTKWFGNWMDIDDHRRMEEQLKAIDRQKNVFLATLGHELRNPLASIVSVVELLRGSLAADGETRREVEVIDAQARQLKRLVDDLVDAARISEGKIRIERRKVELGRIVSQALEEVLPQVEARHHKLAVEIPREPVRLHADPVRLVQVLSNLVSNAARYTKPGGQIALRAEREDGDVVIRVCDNGDGIAAQALPHVFEMFIQGSGPEDGSHEGLGVGLALVRKLVELHGGNVEARSEGPGRGSEFRVRLPVLGDDTSAPETGAEAKVADEGPLGPVRVLIVDDNALLADNFARLLRREGCEVQTAADGNEALRRARELRPQAAFLDLGLPDMSGYQLLERLRQQGCERTLFVAVTGYGEEEAAQMSRRAGFHRHLVKPVELAVAKRVLREISDAARTGLGQPGASEARKG